MAAPEPGPVGVTSGPDWLGPDLDALVAALDVPVRRIVTLTRLRGPAVAHASFRLELMDGHVLKGRRLASAEQAALVAAIVGVMDPRHFPRVIAHSGAAILEEWCAGEARDHSSLGLALIRQCGGILGKVHRTPPPATVGIAPRGRPEAHLAAVRWQSRKLVASGALSDASRRDLLEFLEANLPRDSAIGVVHRDFCAENFVWDVAEQPHVVDNETMQVAALDFDLARTWYRWPMTERQAQAFLDGYSAHRRPDSYLATFEFWGLAVLLEASHFHLRAGTDRAAGTVDLLHAFQRRSTEAGRWRPSP